MSFAEKADHKNYRKNLLIQQLESLTLNSGYPMSAVKSISSVQIENQEHTVCAMADGRLLQFIVDLEILDKIKTGKYPK